MGSAARSLAGEPHPRRSDDAVARFVQEEQEVLRRLAKLTIAGDDRVLQVIGPDGMIAWTSAQRTDPILCMTDVSLHALPGKLRLMRLGEGNDPAEGAWLSVAALLIDSIATRSSEMSTLVEEHIALTDQLLALYNIAQGTRAHLDLGAQLRIVLQEAVRASGMDAGIIVITGGEPRVLCEPQDRGLESFAKALVLMGFDDVREIDDLGALLAHPGIVGRYHTGALGTLNGGGAHEGAIVLLSSDPNRMVLARDAKLAQAMADLAGAFIETASLQQMAVQSLKTAKELEIARDIQTLLMPELLETADSLDLAAFYRPARQVGGDFYLYSALPGERAMIAVGDVAGKGVPAALLMSMTRTAILSLTTEGASPGTILSRTSQVLHADLDRTGKFVTLCIVVYDPRQSLLAVANAGHSPVYLVPAGGAILRLDPTCPPLGVDVYPDVPDTHFVFRQGDLLVLTTDGFSEARDSSGEFFGLDRFERFLASSEHASARDLCSALVMEVMNFSAGMPQADDQTAVVLRGRGAGDSTHGNP